MFKSTQKFLFAICFFFAAQQVSALTFAESAQKKNKSSIYGQLGFNGGGVVLGADYEMKVAKSHSAGGYLKLTQKNATKGAAGMMALGGFIRVHMFKRAWDFYVSPGFGLINYDSTANKTSMLIGPSLALGLKYQFSKKIAAGMESQSLYSWFGDTTGAVGALAMGTFQFGF